jgi:hypothetical protein
MDEAEMINRIQDSYTYLRSVREALQGGKEFSTEALFKRYGFPGIMQKYHDENIILLKKEMGVVH